MSNNRHFKKNRGCPIIDRKKGDIACFGTPCIYCIALLNSHQFPGNKKYSAAPRTFYCLEIGEKSKVLYNIYSILFVYLLVVDIFPKENTFRIFDIPGPYDSLTQLWDTGGKKLSPD